VGGYLKIAPEHTEEGVLSQMMKPKMSSYYEFKRMFDKFSKEAGKEQFLIPYFIAAHPGTRDEDMLNLALWLKKNNFEVDQVQTFYPSPMSLATAMYVSERNPLKKLTYKSGKINIPRGIEQRRLQKALLRYHDPANWPIIREALRSMRKPHLIGSSASALIPDEQAGARNGGRGHNPNARAQGKPAAGKFNSGSASKPAAKAFGDKFESAKKFNAQTTAPKGTGASVKKEFTGAKTGKPQHNNNRPAAQNPRHKPGTPKK
jgi:hypothetical protein